MAMKSKLISAAVFLAVFAPTAAHAFPAPEDVIEIDLGSVFNGTDSGIACGATILTESLNQSSSFRHSGDVTFANDAFTTTGGDGSFQVCVTISYSLASFGAFSGSELISLEGHTVTINVDGIYSYGTWPGSILPKYQVIGVDYAPPGAQSQVTYNSTFMRGGSTSITNSFTNSTSVSVTQSLQFGIVGINVGVSSTVTDSLAQEGDSTTGNSWSIQKTSGDIIRGPASSAAGIDHDYDVVWIWLNPALRMTLTGPNSISWNGYAYNPADPVAGVDVVFLYVYELKNPSTIRANVASLLARSWDTSGLGGLTAADYASILAADPFAANTAFNPNTDTTGRFTREVNQSFNYRPAIAGAQPVTETFTSTAQTTSTSGTGAQDTRSVGFTVGDSFGSSPTGFFGIKLSVDLKATTTFTSTTKTSATNTGMTGQTATFSITGPQASDNYTGPTAIQIWRDNVYGSFMFFGV